MLVVFSGRWIRKQLRKRRIREQLRHERRNVPYTSANVQTSSNDGRVQQNPIYNIGGICSFKKGYILAINLNLFLLLS